MTKGDLKSLLFWLNISVVFCGLPYAVWNFLLESKIFTFDQNIAIIPGYIFVTLFFICILKTATIARKLGKLYSFDVETETIKTELNNPVVKKKKK
jgi:hypothetical protein